MIHYTKSWSRSEVIFRLAGTCWPYGIGPGLIAMALSLALSFWREADRLLSAREEFIRHPYAFRTFVFVLGVMLAFRTNFAYNRYWEGISYVLAMGYKWQDGACMAIAFDAYGGPSIPLMQGVDEDGSKMPHITLGDRGGPTHAVFAAEIMHLCSLLHALALMDLRDDGDLENLIRCDEDFDLQTATETPSPSPSLGSKHTDLAGCVSESAISNYSIALPRCTSTGQTQGDLLRSKSATSFKGRIGISTYTKDHLKEVHSNMRLCVLGGLSDAEREVLEADHQGQPLPPAVRVAMVSGWYMRRLIARQKCEQGDSSNTHPAILSRLYQVISDGDIQYANATKARTPFPFPYTNMMTIFLCLFTLYVPVLMNGIIFNLYLRAFLTFMAAFSYHTLAAVSNNLEDPFFPYDANEAPLQDMQDSLNMRLLTFGCVPGTINKGLTNTRNLVPSDIGTLVNNAEVSSHYREEPPSQVASVSMPIPSIPSPKIFPKIPRSKVAWR